ncbi:MAG: TRAP transporter small permease [Rhodobacteraceae bacterium]|nr:TRAP transporter small permease [Paracoccaceae bacterium]
MRNLYDQINHNAERWLLLVFYTMLVATMFIEVLRREIFSYSSIWGEEIVRYSFIYLAWIGAAAAVRERGHIRIDVIMHYVSPRLKALLYLFGDLVMVAVSIVALIYSYETVHVAAKYGSVTDGLRISRVWFLMAVPFGFALVLWRLAQSILRDIADLRAGRPVYEGDKLFD